jgi:hypothetical protein
VRITLVFYFGYIYRRDEIIESTLSRDSRVQELL